MGLYCTSAPHRGSDSLNGRNAKFCTIVISWIQVEIQSFGQRDEQSIPRWEIVDVLTSDPTTSSQWPLYFAIGRRKCERPAPFWQFQEGVQGWGG